MQVLLYLVQHPNEVALKEKILSSVWEGTFVTDEVLTNAIFELRKALGDDAREPRIIQTVPRKGYRLLVPVESAPAGSRRARNVVAALVVVVAAAVASVYLVRHEAPDLQIRTLPLTGFAGAEEWPAISPDGDRIAFVWDRGKPGPIRSLHVQMIGGGEPLPLTKSDRHEFSPVWSPDGKEIAFLRERNFAAPEGSDVLVIPALGGPERRLSSVASADAPFGAWNPGMAWSPDGRFLAVVDQESPSEPKAIFLLSVETGEKRKVTFPPDNVRGDIQPAFSPDGGTLAFARNPGLRDNQIVLQNLEGGEPKPLARVEGWITDLDWTADGSAVVFVAASESEVGSGLFRVPAAGGDPERLPFGEMAHTFSISRRDNRLVHDRRSWFNYDIWRIDGPTVEARGTPTRLIASSRFDGDQEYSPDGTKIAFASERSGHNNIWICDSEGTGCRQLTDMRAVAPRWSPDGKRLVFMREEQGAEDGLYVTDVEGGFTRPISGTNSNDRRPSWSHDGRWIYFTSRRTGGPQIWRIPAEGGEATQVTRNGGRNPRESPDGQFLFYAEKPELGSIHRVSIHGGEEVPVLKGREAAALAWALWDNKIVYATADRDDPRIHIDVFDLETGESKRIFTSSEKLAIGMSVSPDGHWILASISEKIESDLMLVEGFR